RCATLRGADKGSEERKRPQGFPEVLELAPRAGWFLDHEAATRADCALVRSAYDRSFGGCWQMEGRLDPQVQARREHGRSSVREEDRDNHPATPRTKRAARAYACSWDGRPTLERVNGKPAVGPLRRSGRSR